MIAGASDANLWRKLQLPMELFKKSRRMRGGHIREARGVEAACRRLANGEACDPSPPPSPSFDPKTHRNGTRAADRKRPRRDNDIDGSKTELYLSCTPWTLATKAGRWNVRRATTRISNSLQ